MPLWCFLNEQSQSSFAFVTMYFNAAHHPHSALAFLIHHIRPKKGQKIKYLLLKFISLIFFKIIKKPFEIAMGTENCEIGAAS